MKRLVANHTSPRMHKEVIEQLRDNTLKSRWLKQQATEEFCLAKKIVNHLPIAPTNHLIYKVYNDLINGKFNKLGDINYLNENFKHTLSFAENMLTKQGVIFDYRPDNTRKYEHINDALTKNANLRISTINDPNELVNTKWYNPSEDKDFVITDLVNNDLDFIIDYNDFVDDISVEEFEDWVDDNYCRKVARIKVKDFYKLVESNIVKKKIN